MNNNSSKQMLLSVIGVAVLVVAVVGVSFAFFNYTRTGGQDNVITTGTLEFAFTDTNFITLTNHFPITTDQGLALEDAGDICEFTVSGSAPAGTNIGYTVYAIPGTMHTETGSAYADKERLNDKEVFVALAVDEGTGFTHAANVATGTPMSNLTNGVLGNGTITGVTNGETGANVAQTVKFTARMWVDSSAVHVGDADTNPNTTDYSVTQYAKMYYTMRIKVEANA